MRQSDPPDALMQAFRLEGRVAAITGGARGIGYATAQLFLAAGARVVLLDRDAPAAADAAARLGPGASALALDVSREDEVTRAFDAIVAVFTIIGIQRTGGVHQPHHFSEIAEAAGE